MFYVLHGGMNFLTHYGAVTEHEYKKHHNHAEFIGKMFGRPPIEQLQKVIPHMQP